MNDLGKTLVLVGVVLVLLGLIVGWIGPRLGTGGLPGDIHYQRGNVSFHFPIVTCLVLSAVLSALLWFFRR